MAQMQAIARARTRMDLFEALEAFVVTLGVDGLHIGRFGAHGSFLEWLFAAEVEPERRDGWGESRWERADFPFLDKVSADEPFWSHDCALDSRFQDQEKHRLSGRRVVSLGLFPLFEGSTIAGILAVVCHHPRTADAEMLNNCSCLATFVGSSFERILNEESLVRYRRRLWALHQAARLFGGQLEEQQLLKRAAEALISDFEFADCSICIADEEAGLLREKAYAERIAVPGREMLGFRLDEPHVRIVKAYLTRQPVEILDALSISRAEGWGHIAVAAKLRSALTLPIQAGEHAIGAIGAGQSIAELTPEDTTLLLAFASQLGLAIARLRADHETRRRMRETEDAYAEQARLLATVRQLSTPVMPVYDGILVLPLVGAIDATRSAQIMDVLLGAIQKDGAEVVIIDVTGVPMVDASVADRLLATARAASLLGTACILVGISAELARTMIQSGVDLGSLVMRNNLRSGFLYALSLTRRKMSNPKSTS